MNEFFLSDLRTKEDLKGIAIERWNFSAPSISLISTSLKPETDEKIIDKEILAGAAGLKIIFLDLDDSKKAAAQSVDQFLRSTQREIIKQFDALQRNSSLFVFTTAAGDYWHFVNAQSESGVMKIRRFAITPENRDKLRTACLQLDELKVKPDDSLEKLISKLDNAFSVEAVSDEFYKHFKTVFDDLKDFLFSRQPAAGPKNAHQFTHQLLNRLMFLYFVQKKGCFGGDHNFIRTYWNAYRDNFDGQDEFFAKWLKVLFFESLNHNFFQRDWFDLGGNYPNFNNILAQAPYLNGGLFRDNELDSLAYEIPDKKFNLIFDFLEGYNFTIQESTPLDQDLAIDPEMLGNIYEMLVNVSEIEDEQHQAGIFYTPKVEIELMLRRSLVEFLFRKSGIDKQKLYLFAFPEKEEEAEPDFTEPETKLLLSALESITIVDPACGSGHYLVVAAQILWELKDALYRQTGHLINKFTAKQKIIENSIFGVDVKEWATEIAKLRLWLDLFVDADESQLKTPVPLLPSLSFKVRVGDSLVQEIGGVYFSPAAVHGLPTTLRAELNQIKDYKTRYFRNDPLVDESKIKSHEINFYQDIISEQIKGIRHEILKLKAPLADEFSEQLALIKSGELKPDQLKWQISEKDQKRIDALEKEIDRLKELKGKLSLKSNLAFWPIEFADIFSEKGGFDIVIANPPYVRQEKIGDPVVEGEQPLEDRRAYKAKLERQLQIDWRDDLGKLLKLDKKSDLYIYFYLKGLALLNPSGVMCYISSNSWLDVGYGKNLQAILLKRAPVITILDNQAKRSFKRADVNTIIAFFAAPRFKDWASDLKENMIDFVAFKKSFENVLYSDVFIAIEKATKRESFEDFNVHPIRQYDLWLDGLEQKDEGAKKRLTDVKGEKVKEGFGVYAGNKWGGKYLRAPDIYWTILEKGKDKLVRLGDIAEVRFGIKTGANEFFYLDDAKIIERGIEEEFLRPVIKSPRECKSIVINPDDLKYKIFMCHKSKEELAGTAALEYIKWGETQEFHLRPSCAGRAKWWQAPTETGTVFWGKEIRAIIAAYCSAIPIEADCRLYVANVNEVNQALLNSTMAALLAESSARSIGGGGGPRSMMVYEVQDLPLIAENNCGNRDDLISLFRKLGSKVLKPIVDDISDNSDRRALDSIIFDALNFTQTERDAVYEAVIDLVTKRLEKARSV